MDGELGGRKEGINVFSSSQLLICNQKKILLEMKSQEMKDWMYSFRKKIITCQSKVQRYEGSEIWGYNK